MSDNATIQDDEWRELIRQARQMQVAYGVIQAIHGELSIDAIATGIARSLVELGGVHGAEVAIDASFDSLQVKSSSEAGEIDAPPERQKHFAIHARGVEVGDLTVHCQPDDNQDEIVELVDYVLPTIWMGVDNAISFGEVIDYRNTLEQRVVERTAQLAEANEQLKEAKAARDRFFANINHEIRTPLTLIQLASDAITRTGDALGNTARQKIDEINASTRRLLHLVNSLLLLAAGDEGKLRVRPGPCDVATCLQRLTRNWATAAQKGDIEIVFKGPPECPATMDEAALETIVGNFVSNAVKFTPPKGRITVTLTASDESVTISVRDTGPGIEPEFIPKLFGRFERAASAASRGVRGTGIGLSLSKELVDLQQGSIRVERHEDPRGTSFEVTLPRHQAVAAILPPEAQPSQPSHNEAGGRVVAAALQQHAPPSREPEATILLAEDDPGLSQHITDLLSSRYRVLAAPNGKAALALAREHIPDLLVTDLEMPEMNGIELTREFLALQGTTLSPVLIVSAHAGLGERLAGFEAGAVDYVLKPFSADELLARIRSQLAIRKLALKLHESQKLAAMGMLSAGLAHELRNPANALVNALHPLMDLLPQLKKKDESAEAMLAEIALEAANQIRERCSRILDFSRAENVSVRPENVRTLLARARRMLTTQLAGVEVRERIEVDGNVYCAGPLIEQILINLLDNAAFAAGPGGWVSIGVRREDTFVVIEISDSGPGVPPQLLERIFDPFFTTKPVGKGTGLGLTISRRIAQNHGGELRVLRRGDGSVFRLELPQEPG